MKCNCLCHALPSIKPYECICCIKCPKCNHRISVNKINKHAKECSNCGLEKESLITKMKADIERLKWLRDEPIIYYRELIPKETL